MLAACSFTSTARLFLLLRRFVVLLAASVTTLSATLHLFPFLLFLFTRTACALYL